MYPERVIEHGAQRRNARSASDEQHPPMAQRPRKGKGPNRTFDVYFFARMAQRQVRTCDAIFIDANEQLETIGFRGALGRRGNGVRPPHRLSVVTDNDRLPCDVRERDALEVERHEPRAWRYRGDVDERECDDRGHRE